MTCALSRRNIPQTTATVAAELGILTFKTAFVNWIQDADARTFGEFAREALAELHAAQITLS